MSDTDTQRPDERVERIRRAWPSPEFGKAFVEDDDPDADVAREAYDDIAALLDAYDEQRARAERAEATQANLLAACGYASTCNSKMLARLVCAETDVARLREAGTLLVSLTLKAIDVPIMPAGSWRHLEEAAVDMQRALTAAADDEGGGGAER